MAGGATEQHRRRSHGMPDFRPRPQFSISAPTVSFRVIPWLRFLEHETGEPHSRRHNQIGAIHDHWKDKPDEKSGQLIKSTGPLRRRSDAIASVSLAGWQRCQIAQSRCGASLSSLHSSCFSISSGTGRLPLKLQRHVRQLSSRWSLQSSFRAPALRKDSKTVE